MNGRERPIEWPDLAQYSQEPFFNTKAVVQRTGIPAPTLRAWERRYKIVSPGRAGNTYRLYSERDIILLLWLKNRIESGMSISQAIALFHYLSKGHQGEKQDSGSQPLSEHPIDYAAIQAAIRAPQSDLSQKARQVLSTSAQSITNNEATHTTGSTLASDRVSDLQSPTVGRSYPIVYSLIDLREHIIDTFQRFDDTTASTLMSATLAIHPLEQVCTDLITPTLWQVGQLWAKGKLTVSVEHFASNFFRGLLANLLYVTPNPGSEQPTIVCSAPGEPHELAALMLALFLRRRGMRVVYLGQNIEITGLLQTIKTLIPNLLCISLTIPACLPGLINLGRQVQELPEPRPLLVFGGQVFINDANTISQIPGLYQEGDLTAITDRLYDMIQKGTQNKR